MKVMIRISLMAVAAMLILSSCKKEDVKTQTKTELVTQGNWKLVSDMSKSGTGQWVEDIGSYATCESDNYFAFKADHTLEFNEGATMCDVTDPQSQTGIWAFTDNETKLSLNGAPADLNELTSTSLIITFSFTGNGVTEYNKLTFRH
jgi:hypothetical protein